MTKRSLRSFLEDMMILYAGTDAGCYFFKFPSENVAMHNLIRLGMKIGYKPGKVTLTLEL